jgi:GntR family transcriptional regulator/MocR family aminotransferase
MNMLGLTVEKNAVPAVRQLCEQLRLLIGSGQLPAGLKLPSTRQLAAALGIARNTVVDAYEQLIAEGFLESRVGSGTYVAEGADVLRTSRRPVSEAFGGRTGAAPFPSPTPASPSASSPAPKSASVPGRLIDFTGGFPDLSLFPRRVWGIHLRNAVLDSPDDLFGYGDAFGDPVLREQLSAYLFRAKGLRVQPDRIAVVSGSSEGFLLIAHALADRFRTVVVEDPTVEFGRDIFARCGYRLKPVDVDGQGIRADLVERLEPEELMLLTPSHQFPTGSILSVQRRHRLIGLAEAAGSFLIEDDYDSEFRFKGSPVPPLLALAPERVIHVGTFSKTLAPGLRLGFVVIPPALVDRFRQTKDALTLLTPNAEQRALAAMLASGDFERHLYRMVKVYRHKRGVLKEALETHFPGMLDIRGDDAGMHLLARFRTVAEPDDAAAAGPSERPEAGLRGSPDTGRHEPSEADPSRVKILRNLHDVKWENAVSFGVRIQCADDYRLAGGGLRRDLVLGYGHLSAADIREGVARLAAFLKEAAG